MSGGHFDYAQYSTRDAFEGQWDDAEIDGLFYDLFCAPLYGRREGGLATALDLYLSGDIGEEAYREYVRSFKEKWIGRTDEDRIEFYKQKLQERCDKLKAEL